MRRPMDLMLAALRACPGATGLPFMALGLCLWWGVVASNAATDSGPSFAYESSEEVPGSFLVISDRIPAEPFGNGDKGGSQQQANTGSDATEKPAPSNSASSVFEQEGEDKKFKVTPYGAFWSDMIYATSRVDPGAFTFWVFSDQQHGESAFVIDARRSRFGIDVDGPAISLLGNAKTRGKVEIDFYGDFVSENLASVLVRQAYWEATNRDYRFLVGQTWDVISPLNPGMLNYSVGWNGGNIGFRRAQVRLERYFYPSPSRRWAIQGSLDQDIVVDFSTDIDVRRESAAWPVVQGRLGLNLGPLDRLDETAQLGVSGHIGQTGFDFLMPGPPPTFLPPADDQRFLTWSANLDWRWPVTNRFLAQGELFAGENLSSFLGGIGQGVCPCQRVPIQTAGGWANLQFAWTPRVKINFGYGLDDPRNSDFRFGRTFNRFIFANLTCQVSDAFLTGWEVASWRTLYQDDRVGLIPDDELLPTAPGNAVVLRWMFKYSF